MVLKEKQMTSEAGNALSKEQSHISDELIARVFLKAFGELQLPVDTPS